MLRAASCSVRLLICKRLPSGRSYNFPFMRNMQELAYDIIRYYTDPFGEIQQESDGVERSRLYQETIYNRVIKRSIGK